MPFAVKMVWHFNGLMTNKLRLILLLVKPNIAMLKNALNITLIEIKFIAMIV